MAELITGNGGKLDYTAADKAEHDKFASTPLGKKFITAYIDEAEAYEKRKEEAVRTRTPDADGFAIYQPEKLNRLFNKFVAENYKNRFEEKLSNEKSYIQLAGFGNIRVRLNGKLLCL